MPQDKTKDASYVNDFQTPDNVAIYMASLIPGWCKTVLEPTPGLGSLVKAAENLDYHVEQCSDYWLLDKSKRFDAIISNLPFSSKTWFNCPPEYEGKGMKVAYEQMKVLMNMSSNLIMLMPWFTISDSDVRLRFIKEYGLVSVTALPRKTFQYARIQTCVLELQEGYIGSTEFKVFDLLNDTL